MREIATTQGSAGLPPELFKVMTRAYEELAGRAPSRATDDVPAGLSWAPALRELS